jgi:hypothetical protein
LQNILLHLSGTPSSVIVEKILLTILEILVPEKYNFHEKEVVEAIIK